jgi:hypothetical protein
MLFLNVKFCFEQKIFFFNLKTRRKVFKEKMSSDQEYGSFKRFEKRDMTEKYGFKQSGFVALENIKKGEAIHRCDPKICDYLQLDEIHKGYTRDEMLEMRKIDQKTDQFIEWYSYMVIHISFRDLFLKILFYLTD